MRKCIESPSTGDNSGLTLEQQPRLGKADITHVCELLASYGASCLALSLQCGVNVPCEQAVMSDVFVFQ